MEDATVAVEPYAAAFSTHLIMYSDLRCKRPSTTVLRSGFHVRPCVRIHVHARPVSRQQMKTGNTPSLSKVPSLPVFRVLKPHYRRRQETQADDIWTNLHARGMARINCWPSCQRECQRAELPPGWRDAARAYKLHTVDVWKNRPVCSEVKHVDSWAKQRGASELRQAPDALQHNSILRGPARLFQLTEARNGLRCELV